MDLLEFMMKIDFEKYAIHSRIRYHPEDDIECELLQLFLFFTCLPKEILPASIFRQLEL